MVVGQARQGGQVPFGWVGERGVPHRRALTAHDQQVVGGGVGAEPRAVVLQQRTGQRQVGVVGQHPPGCRTTSGSRFRWSATGSRRADRGADPWPAVFAPPATRSLRSPPTAPGRRSSCPSCGSPEPGPPPAPQGDGAPEAPASLDVGRVDAPGSSAGFRRLGAGFFLAPPESAHLACEAVSYPATDQQYPTPLGRAPGTFLPAAGRVSVGRGEHVGCLRKVPADDGGRDLAV